MNAKGKGSRNERKSKELLERAGYAVTKSGGSLGAWDLIGIRADGFVVCQVKSNQFPSLAEMAKLRAFKVPSNCQRLVHRWRDYARLPDVRELSDQAEADSTLVMSQVFGAEPEA